MKILHVITSLQTGGAERLMVDLLPRLKSKGNEVDLIVFKEGNTPFYNELVSSGIKVDFLGKGYYNLLYVFKLFSIIKKYDIIHTHNTSPQLFVALASLFSSVKLCTTEHNTSNRRRSWAWYRPIDRWMYGRYKKVICISNQAEQNLRGYLNVQAPNIITIFNGINFGKFANAKSEDANLGYSKSIKLIMVAAFRPQKDQTTLIKALSLLPSNYQLFLVGDGECRSICEELAKSLEIDERVHFLGIRNNIPSLLKSADIVVMSSHYEGLSLSNLEGMASGRPFIASDVDGLREVVKGYGVLFPHGNAEVLAKEILHLAEDKEYAAEVARRCQKRAADFDISVMAEKYNQVYQELMGTID